MNNSYTIQDCFYYPFYTVLQSLCLDLMEVLFSVAQGVLCLLAFSPSSFPQLMKVQASFGQPSSSHLSIYPSHVMPSSGNAVFRLGQYHSFPESFIFHLGLDQVGTFQLLHCTPGLMSILVSNNVIQLQHAQFCIVCTHSLFTIMPSCRHCGTVQVSFIDK